jgi:hypothetical protein
MSRIIISDKRKIEISEEAKRRLGLLLSKKSFNELTSGGSRMIFIMCLGLYRGYPFEREDWMDENDFLQFVSAQESESIEYDAIIDELFDDSYNKLYV